MTEPHSDPSSAGAHIPWARPVRTETASGDPTLFARPAGTLLPAGPMILPADVSTLDATVRPDDPMLLHRCPRLAALIDAGLLIVIFVSSQVLIYFLLQAFLDVNLEDPETAKLFLPPLTLVNAALLFAYILFITRMRGLSPASVGLTLRKWGLNALVGLACCCVIYGLLLTLVLLAITFAPEFTEDMKENAERLTHLVPRMSPFRFLLLASVVGFYEELVFRGFLMPRLRRCLGSWTLAVLVSSVAFTALHVDQVAVARGFIFLLSVIFSVATIWRRSLVPAIVAHMLFDFAEFLLMTLSYGQNWS